MKQRVYAGLLCFILSLAYAPKVFAVTSISSTSINPPEVYDTIDNQITVTIDQSADTTAYIRPVFYKQGTSDYFGCALSSGAYYCGTDDYTNYTHITGPGSITLSIHSDSSSTNYKKTGIGDYAFKVRRCTVSAAGNASCSYDSSEQYPVHVTQVTPAPTASATPVPTVTPSPIPTPTPTT